MSGIPVGECARLCGPADHVPSCPLVQAGRSQVLCTNEEHEEDTPALYRVTFPDGDWNPCTACKDCLQIVVENMLDTPVRVLFEAATR